MVRRKKFQRSGPVGGDLPALGEGFSFGGCAQNAPRFCFASESSWGARAVRCHCWPITPIGSSVAQPGAAGNTSVGSISRTWSGCSVWPSNTTIFRRHLQCRCPQSGHQCGIHAHTAAHPPSSVVSAGACLGGETGLQADGHRGVTCVGGLPLRAEAFSRKRFQVSIPRTATGIERYLPVTPGQISDSATTSAMCCSRTGARCLICWRQLVPDATKMVPNGWLRIT